MVLMLRFPSISCLACSMRAIPASVRRFAPRSFWDVGMSTTAATDRSVDVQIVGLRKKLGPYGKYIETVRGVGYRFKETQ